MPGRGYGRRSRGIRRVQSEVAQLRRELNGHTTRTHMMNPPVVNLRPYYPLRISLDIDTPGIEFGYSVRNLVSRVADQLGLSAQGKTKLTVKLQSLHGWAFMYGSSEDRVAMTGNISSLVPAVSDVADPGSETTIVTYPILYTFQDFGTLNRPAHFGYVFPRSMQDIPLSIQSDFTVLSVSTNTKNATLHFNLKWSTGDVNIPPQMPPPGWDALQAIGPKV